MSGFRADQFDCQPLDHLGLVAATIDYLGLEELIDKMLPLREDKGVKVPMGKRVSAMILNGLGFIDERLYMFSEFLETKPVARLLGPEMKAEYFNDSALGRCLDAIHEYGVSQFFSNISVTIARKLNLLGKTLNLDTTTLTVFGEYAEDVAEETKDPNLQALLSKVMPKYGFSKQKRMDLKQMILLLATTGKSNFPLFMQALSGNASDKKTLHAAMETVQNLIQKLEDSPRFIFIADSAAYLECVNKNTENLMWISRVPEVVKEAKNLVSQDKITWSDYGDGYQISPQKSLYGGVEQRWILVYSEQAYQREVKTLEKKILAEKEKQEKAVAKFLKKNFESKEAAQAEIKIFKKSLKYYEFEFEIAPNMGNEKPGKPKAGGVQVIKSYSVTGTLSPNEDAIGKARRSKGRFIVATNELSKEVLSDADILKEYKSQASIEPNFSFIKDTAFEVDSIFLKKPSRIEALMAVMVLCLMVFNVSQFRLREALAKNNDMVEDRRGKLTKKPCMKSTYKMFAAVTVLNINIDKKSQQVVTNIKERLVKIIQYFGPKAIAIYSLGDFKTQ